MRRVLNLAAGLLALFCAGDALAQGQVYDPVPPRGSAYLRIVNGVEGELSARPDFLPAQRLGVAPAQRAMPFTVVPNVANRPLRVELQEGARRGQVALRIEPGSFVTLLVHRTADGLAATAITDVPDFNRARSRLAFYNGLAECPAATLSLLPSGPAIFEGVPSLATRARSVNPVTAQISASCGERAAAPIALEGLEAGGMYSIWLIGGRAAPIAFLSRDTTAVYRP